MKSSFFKFFFVTFFSALTLFFVNVQQASAQSACESMKQCYSSCSGSSCSRRCGVYALECAKGSDRAVERYETRRRTQGSDCTDLMGDCNKKCSGNNIMSCLQRCSDEAFVCTQNERQQRRSSSTGTNNHSNAYSKSNRSVVNTVPKINDGTSINKSGAGGYTKEGNTTAKDEYKLSDKKLSETVTPEIMSKISVMGANKAMKCTSFEKDNNGYLSLRNICSEKINYHYCYDNWTPNPNIAGGNTNPFKCDLNRNPSFSGADSILGNSLKKLPLQSGALKKRTRVGPCMSVVMSNGIRYNYLSAKRTGEVSGNSYKCNYYRASME